MMACSRRSMDGGRFAAHPAVQPRSKISAILSPVSRQGRVRSRVRTACGWEVCAEEEVATILNRGNRVKARGRLRMIALLAERTSALGSGPVVESVTDDVWFSLSAAACSAVKSSTARKALPSCGGNKADLLLRPLQLRLDEEVWPLR